MREGPTFAGRVQGKEKKGSVAHKVPPHILGRTTDLIREHFIHSLLLEDLLPRRRMHAIIQQHANNLTILRRFRKAPGPARIKRPLHILRRHRAQRRLIQMPIRPQTQLPLRIPLVHVREILLHVCRREHVDVLDAHGREDVLLEVVVQGHAADAGNDLARPVDVDAVFPGFAGLVDERLGQRVPGQAGEFVEPTRRIVLVQAGVEEGVAEAGWSDELVSSTRLWYRSVMGVLPVCESSILSVMPFFLGTSFLPSITSTLASSCSQQFVSAYTSAVFSAMKGLLSGGLLTGAIFSICAESSSDSFPCSTSCMHAIPVIIFVQLS